MAEHFDIIIVGGGPAGLTAAIYARRAGKSVLLLEKESFGGQIASSPKVENFPGFTAISGAELADRLYEQADALGARIELEEVLSVAPGIPHTVTTDYGTYTGTALILATGMKHRTLGLVGEDTMAGISFCAVCDGAFYAGRDTAVCGGGNTALQDAIYLADICHHVYLIHRRAEFRGDPILVETLKKRENVTILTDTVIDLPQRQVELTDDLAHEAAIPFPKFVGNHLISRQATGQIEINLPIPDVFFSGSGQYRCGRKQTDAIERLAAAGGEGINGE